MKMKKKEAEGKEKSAPSSNRPGESCREVREPLDPPHDDVREDRHRATVKVQPVRGRELPVAVALARVPERRRVPCREARARAVAIPRHKPVCLS